MTDRQSFIKGVLDRVESHVEQWREQDQRRKAETEEARGKLWEEEAERETAGPGHKRGGGRRNFLGRSGEGAAGRLRLAFRGKCKGA